MIEVGVAIYDRHETIQTWSSLVRLSPHCQWDEKAAAVHKIARADLQDAPEPHFVAGELNRVMDGVAAAYCDGNKYDAAWMNNLYRTAGITPSFELNPLEELPRTHMRIVRMHMGAYMGRTMAPHRAGPDALRLMQAYCYALGKKPAVVAAELIRFLV